MVLEIERQRQRRGAGGRDLELRAFDVLGKIAMLEKERLENGNVRITFRVSHYIWADTISLVGEFNDWDAQSHPLRRSRDDGEWHISLLLKANSSYRFRYLVDGKEWMDDDHADGYEPNPYGGFDSVVST
jgi:1,4-alpha-glucan branching enzyme